METYENIWTAITKCIIFSILCLYTIVEYLIIHMLLQYLQLYTYLNDYVCLSLNMVCHVLLIITPSRIANAFWRSLAKAWTGCLAPTRLDQLGHDLSMRLCLVVFFCARYLGTDRKLLPREHTFCRFWFVWYYNIVMYYHRISKLIIFGPNQLWSCPGRCQSRVPTTSGLTTALNSLIFLNNAILGLSSLPNR